jgi:regulator of protease activity HflC (stomatin/prohibitin superfamily)
MTMNYPQRAHEPTEERTREHPTTGWVGLLFALALGGVGFLLVVRGEVPAVLLVALAFLLLKGLFTLEPNQAAVLVFVGEYAGTVRKDGFFFVNPLYARRKLSLRVRNFATPTLKVNDQRGNPIEIAAVITWHVHDTGQAVFDVDSFESYTQVQSEMALREVAGSHPYESLAPGEVSLRSHFTDISKLLTATLRQHLAVAGVEVDDARITHLAYAPEIAHVMLRRQQAEAVVHARTHGRRRARHDLGRAAAHGGGPHRRARAGGAREPRHQHDDRAPVGEPGAAGDPAQRQPPARLRHGRRLRSTG